MEPKINKKIKNETIKQDCKIKYKDSEKWKNFVDRIQKNPWIREMVLKMNNGLCAYCGLSKYDRRMVKCGKEQATAMA